MDSTKESEIAHKNDVFRKLGFGITVTNDVAALPDLTGLMQAIRDYCDFTEDNDPYHEHDFGRLDWSGVKIFWKIDYYNGTLDAWEDPLLDKCKRIMTVMLAEEY